MPHIYTYIFANISPGETTATKRADGDRVMANFYAIEKAVFAPFAEGADAVDGNSEGMSIATECRLTIYTEEIAGESRVGGLLDLGDYVEVSDGSTIWSLTNTVANDELTFNATHIAKGSDVADYSDSGFIDDLEIHIYKFGGVYGKDRLILSGSHAQKITGSDLERSSSDTDDIGATLAAAETAFENEHETDGTHSDDVLTTDNIAASATLYETFHNLVYGTMDYDEDDDGRPDGWIDFNTPTSVSLESTASKVKEGSYSCKLVASQADDGIQNDPNINTIDPDLFKGRKLVLAAWVWCTSNDTAVLEIYDGVGTTACDAGGTASGWVRLYVVRTIDASATEITPRIYATEATTIYIDAVMFCQGKLAAGFVPHVNEEIRARLANASQVNWLLNPSFADWSSGIGGSDFPDFWNGTCVLQLEGGGAEGGFLEQAKCTFDLAETLYQELPLPIVTFMVGRTVYFVAEIKSWAANDDKLRMKVDDGQGSPSYVDVVPGSVGTYIRRGVKHTVDGSATELTVSFENQDADTISVMIRNAVLTVDIAPVGFIPSAYKPYYLYFNYSGALPTSYAYMTGEHGFASEAIFPSRGIIQSLGVKLTIAPGAGRTSDFEIWFDSGALTGYHVDIDDTDTEGSDGIDGGNAQVIDGWDATNFPTIGVKCVMLAGAAAANAQAVVKLLVWE